MQIAENLEILSATQNNYEFTGAVGSGFAYNSCNLNLHLDCK